MSGGHKGKLFVSVAIAQVMYLFVAFVTDKASNKSFSMAHDEQPLHVCTTSEFGAKFLLNTATIVGILKRQHCLNSTESYPRPSSPQ